MKKKLGLFNKLMYWTNLVVALLLLISFVLPYIPPQRFPTLSLLSLAVFPLIIINSLFVLYWIFKLKLKVLISTSILLITHFHFGSFIHFILVNVHKMHPTNLIFLMMLPIISLPNAFSKRFQI